MSTLRINKVILREIFFLRDVVMVYIMYLWRLIQSFHERKKTRGLYQVLSVRTFQSFVYHRMSGIIFTQKFFLKSECDSSFYITPMGGGERTPIFSKLLCSPLNGNWAGGPCRSSLKKCVWGGGGKSCLVAAGRRIITCNKSSFTSTW